MAIFLWSMTFCSLIYGQHLEYEEVGPGEINFTIKRGTLPVLNEYDEVS